MTRLPMMQMGSGPLTTTNLFQKVRCVRRLTLLGFGNRGKQRASSSVANSNVSSPSGANTGTSVPSGEIGFIQFDRTALGCSCRNEHEGILAFQGP